MENFIIPKIILLLSEELNTINSSLFIVGGYVRNYFLNCKSMDIDLCSKTKIKDIIPILQKLNISILKINELMGTLKLQYDNLNFEYSTFRYESYKSMGARIPNIIEFVDDINIDVIRRDFTINALYYDIKNKKIIDLVNGMEDIKNKVIREVEDDTLDYDATRIFRLIKFVTFYNLKVDENTILHAKNNLYLINKLSLSAIEKQVDDIMSIVCANNIGPLKLIVDILSFDSLQYNEELIPIITEFLAISVI